MSFFSAFRKKVAASSRVLVIHVGSAVVSGAFVDVHAGAARVVACVSSDIAVLPDVDHARFEAAMLVSLGQTLNKLSALHLAPPERIAVNLSSPWFASQVRVARASRTTPFVVSKTSVTDMITRELKAFEEEEMAAAKDSGTPLRAIESKTLLAKLNGYPTSDPLGKSARELELSIFLSVAPERTLAQIEQSVARVFQTPVRFNSFLLASFMVSRDLFPNQDNYLLIDVGGEITEVSIVRDNAISRSLSFPRGRNFILRKLSAGLKRSIPEVLGLCTLYVEGKVEGSVKESCAAILGDAKNEWLDAFQHALFSATDEVSLPDTVFLTVGEDIAPWFIETIRREDFHQYTGSEKEFKIVLLSPSLLHEKLSFDDGVVRNPFIMIGAIAQSHT